MSSGLFVWVSTARTVEGFFCRSPRGGGCGSQLQNRGLFPIVHLGMNVAENKLLTLVFMLIGWSAEMAAGEQTGYAHMCQTVLSDESRVTFMVDVRAGRPQKFEFGSSDQAGHICSISGSRSESQGAIYSEWSDSESVSIVKEKFEKEIMATVKLTMLPNGVSIEVLSYEYNLVCGHNGLLHPSAILNFNKPECELSR